MTLRILLIGKNGQVGGDLQSYLPPLGKVIAPGREELDLADPEAIRRTLRGLRPQLIVNAAGYTAVDEAETEPEKAQAVNATAPAVMAEEAKKIGATLVHYSTDYVFDGRKTTPYEESDEPNPINLYGKTKLAGERAIHDAGVPYLILRTSWIYATRGKNFLLTVLRLASQKEELRVVDDQIGSPTWSRMVAVATAQILARVCSPELDPPRLRELSGIYHLTAAGETSWCGFTRAILEECSDPTRLGPWFKAATDGRPLLVQRVVPILACDYQAPARRPAYSVLSSAKLLRTFGVQLPDWRAQLQLALQNANAGDFLHLITSL